MSYDYLSTNRALLSRYNPDEIIYLNLNKRFIRRLQAGKGVSMLDYQLGIVVSLVPFAIGAFIGLLGSIVGGGITLFALVRLANQADQLDRLWKGGALIEAEDVQVEEKEVKDSDGDISTVYFVHYLFCTPHGEVLRGEKEFNISLRDARTMLMLYRSPKEYLIV